MKNEKIVRTTVRSEQQPTEARICEIEKDATIPAIPDADAPEPTSEQYAETAVSAKGNRSKMSR